MMTIVSDGLRLEGVLSYPDTAPGIDLAVLANPHPCLGGDMDNNVILALETEALRAGFATLRFNFRGVGASQTHRPLEALISAFWEDPAIDPPRETALIDLHSAVEHGITTLASRPRHLVVLGYSFGAAMALLESRRRSDLRGLGLISPPIHQIRGDILPAHRIPVVIARAASDFAVEPAALARLEERLGPSATTLLYSDTDHFYRGREGEVASDVLGHLVQGL